jgi:hypothetical protein
MLCSSYCSFATVLLWDCFFTAPYSHFAMLQPVYDRLLSLPAEMVVDRVVDGEVVGTECFTFEYFNCGDFASMCKLYGLLGQNSVHNCIW